MCAYVATVWWQRHLLTKNFWTLEGVYPPTRLIALTSQGKNSIKIWYPSEKSKTRSQAQLWVQVVSHVVNSRNSWKKQNLEKGFQLNIAVISALKFLGSTPTLAGGLCDDHRSQNRYFWKLCRWIDYIFSLWSSILFILILFHNSMSVFGTKFENER